MFEEYDFKEIASLFLVGHKFRLHKCSLTVVKNSSILPGAYIDKAYAEKTRPTVWQVTTTYQCYQTKIHFAQVSFGTWFWDQLEINSWKWNDQFIEFILSKGIPTKNQFKYKVQIFTSHSKKRHQFPQLQTTIGLEHILACICSFELASTLSKRHFIDFFSLICQSDAFRLFSKSHKTHFVHWEH